MKFLKPVFVLIFFVSLTNCAPNSNDPPVAPPPVEVTALPEQRPPVVAAPVPPEIKQPDVTVPLIEPEIVDPLLNVDLLALQKKETRYLTPAEVLKLNEQTFENLYATPLPAQSHHSSGRDRIQQIDPVDAQKVIDSINVHPVVAYYSDQKYSQPSAKIGYCFGRATYVHLTLALHKFSIYCNV